MPRSSLPAGPGSVSTGGEHGSARLIFIMDQLPALIRLAGPWLLYRNRLNKDGCVCTPGTLAHAPQRPSDGQSSCSVGVKMMLKTVLVKDQLLADT